MSNIAIGKGGTNACMGDLGLKYWEIDYKTVIG